MDKLIDHYTRKYTIDKSNENKEIKRELDEIRWVKEVIEKDKLVVYNEIFDKISMKKLANNIGKAKADNENYVIVFYKYYNNLFIHCREIKELVHSFNPHNKGTIYEILTNLLPIEYKISIEENTNFMGYSFQLYISWNDLSLLDKFNTWI